MPKRFLIYSRTQPARTIMAIATYLTLFAGLWLFSPWFVGLSVGLSLVKAFSWPVLTSGVLTILMCIPGLIGVKVNTPAWLAHGAFVLFVYYLLISFARMFVYSFGSLAFIPTLIISGILAVIYLEQRTHLHAKEPQPWFWLHFRRWVRDRW